MTALSLVGTLTASVAGFVAFVAIALLGMALLHMIGKTN